MLPTVSVVLSSYNGEEYLVTQIDSIMNQHGVEVNLHIRDDGSNESTRLVLSRYTDNPRITVEFAENVGFAESFMRALEAAPEAEYYAFSDQDDYWMPEKLLATVSMLEKQKQSECRLGYTNAIVTDENLSPIRPLYDKVRKVPDPSVAMASPVCHGFLMVFSKALRDAVLSCERPKTIPHDIWVGYVAVCIGSVYYYGKELALYRRLPNSLSNKRRMREFVHHIKSLIDDYGIAPTCAASVLNEHAGRLSDEYAALLNDISCYRYTREAKRRLLFDYRIRKNNILATVFLKIKILLNRY